MPLCGASLVSWESPLPLLGECAPRLLRLTAFRLELVTHIPPPLGIPLSSVLGFANDAGGSCHSDCCLKRTTTNALFQYNPAVTVSGNQAWVGRSRCLPHELGAYLESPRMLQSGSTTFSRPDVQFCRSLWRKLTDSKTRSGQSPISRRGQVSARCSH